MMHGPINIRLLLVIYIANAPKAKFAYRRARKEI